MHDRVKKLEDWVDNHNEKSKLHDGILIALGSSVVVLAVFVLYLLIY